MKSRHAAFAVTAAAAGVAMIASALRDGAIGITKDPSRQIAVATVSRSGGAFPTAAATVAAIPDAGRPLAPSLPRQLTDPGCCSGAWWADDSSGLLFLSRAEGGSTATIMLAPLWPPGRPVEAPGVSLTAHAAGRYVVRQVGGQSEVEDLESGARWELPTDGGQVLMSPIGSRVVWWNGRADESYFRSLVTISSSELDGTDVRELVSMWRAVVVAFHPDGKRVLVTGRPIRGQAMYSLALLDIETGEMQQLARGSWLSDALLSPSGDWVVYMTSLDRDNPESNGIWVVATSSGEPRKLDFVGAYRWRDGDRLILVPMDPDVEYHSVWQVDMGSYELNRLVDPEEVAIRIADNDWSISPDGHTMAYLSEHDRGIWVIDLPP